MSAIEQLFSNPAALDHGPEMDQLFLQAMLESVAFHREHSPLYEGLCRLHGFEAATVQGVDDLKNLPHVIVTAFKERSLLSVPESEIVTTFTSSGTTGQMSKLFWDTISQERQLFTRKSVVAAYGLVDKDPVNYLCFSYDPASSGRRGAAHTHTAYAAFAPAREMVYAITQGQDGEPHFRLDDCVAALRRFAESGLPLRVTGFPAFGYTTLKHLEDQGIHFQFPARSLLFSGGGWKLHTGQAIPYEEYVDLVHKVLGIAPERIRDVYGMVEHGIPYLTCEKGHFHVPIYSRVWSVDPRTERVLPYGQTGLFKLITPYIRSQPSLSVLSTDLGQVHQGCDCGRSGDYLLLRGRGGVKKYDGCAISAAQLLGQ